MGVTTIGMREVSRHAVRAELARVAFSHFCMTGFNQVTFADLAGAAGVSRSTFLRYFGTKEDVVLFVFDPLGDVIAEALDAASDGVAGEGGKADDHRDEGGRVATQVSWPHLRTALEAALAFLVREIEHLPTVLDLIEQTPALGARLWEKQVEWRRSIVARLPMAVPAQPSVVTDVRVAAALDCLWIVLQQWSGTGGVAELNHLLDTAYTAFVPLDG